MKSPGLYRVTGGFMLAVAAVGLLHPSWVRAADAATASAVTQPATHVAGFQGGGSLLGQAEAIAAPPMKLRWTFKTSEADRAAVEGSPLIVGQSVFIADSAGTLHAVDLATGKVRWQYKTDNGFATTPLFADGKVLLGDLVGIFHAVSADTGQKLWTIDTESSIHASANAAGTSVLFGNDAADLYCVNAADGKVIWKAQGGDRVNSAPSINQGTAYFSGCDAQLRALDIAKGQELWVADLGALAPGSAVLVQDRLVVGTDQGRVLCMGLDTKQLWVYTGVANEAMVYASPAVADGVVVVGARDRQVHAIDLATGKPKWTFKTRGEIDAPAVISGGRVYIGSKDKKLYVLDLQTGKSLWEFNAARGIQAGVAIGNGVLIVADSAGSVFCFEAESR